MSWLLIIATTLFVAYISMMCAMFGVPPSISETYYLLDRRKKGRGKLFMLWCLLMVACLAPFWFQTCNENTTFLAWFAAMGLLFVGGAPLFKDAHMRGVHKIGAITAALATTLILAFNGLGIYPLIIYPIALLFIIIYRKNWLFWAELTAFGTTLMAFLIKTFIN